MEIRLAAAVLFVHRAQSDFGMTYEDVVSILNKEPQDLIQTAEAFGAAWAKVQKAGQSIKQS